MTEALGTLWKDGAKDILTIASSEEVVNKMGDLSRLVPSEAINNAITNQMSLAVAAKIPQIRNLGPIGKLADRFARSVMAGGGEVLKKDILAASLKESRSKAVARAFILSAGIDVPGKWSQEEEEHAKFLKQFVDKLIASEGKDYIAAMENLLAASGSGERL